MYASSVGASAAPQRSQTRLISNGIDILQEPRVHEVVDVCSQRWVLSEPAYRLPPVKRSPRTPAECYWKRGRPTEAILPDFNRVSVRATPAALRLQSYAGPCLRPLTLEACELPGKRCVTERTFMWNGQTALWESLLLLVVEPALSPCRAHWRAAARWPAAPREQAPMTA
jgi:hypothetical protein